MKVKVNRDKCIGCGACTVVCPEIFELEDGKSKVKLEDVPENLKDKVKEAKDVCPVGAIEYES